MTKIIASNLLTSSDDVDAVLARLSFVLSPERIAQVGANPRDSSKLMVVTDKSIYHHVFCDLPSFLRPGDVLVLNESRVLPARILARKPVKNVGGKSSGGGQIEVLLLREEERSDLGPHVWSAYLKPARRAGEELILGTEAGHEHRAKVVLRLPDGARLLSFEYDIKPYLDEIGQLPLPPYIAPGQDALFSERYQTVYACTPGSVAAPTAGLHFTPRLLKQLDDLGIERHTITLHVGAGTFKPITGRVADHIMHAERYFIGESVARAINVAKAEGRRVIAVGTTTVRALESSVSGGLVYPGEGETSIFITPGTRIHVPDLLITNFHLPDSTLLLLVAAFAGEKQIRLAYRAALDGDYKFYSLGDAMLLERANR